MVAKQNATLPSVEQVRASLTYDPDTGSLRWKWRLDISDSRNRLFAGKEAGRFENRGYRQVTFNGRGIQAHRLIWVLVYGEWPVAEIDHINHVRADNRLVNLRAATRQQNVWNTKGPYASNRNGFKGASWKAKNGKWQASITDNGKRRYLGLFNTAEEAVAVYQAECIRLRGEFAGRG